MNILQFSYLISAVLFIFGIKSLSSPETARRGMNLAAFGMLIAVGGTLFNSQIVCAAELLGDREILEQILIIYILILIYI